MQDRSRAPKNRPRGVQSAIVRSYDAARLDMYHVDRAVSKLSILGLDSIVFHSRIARRGFRSLSKERGRHGDSVHACSATFQQSCHRCISARTVRSTVT